MKIVGLCLSSFSLGISLTGLFFTAMNYREADRKLKQSIKKQEAKKKIPPFRNIHEPLAKLPGESSEHFAYRVQEALNLGELTTNAARKSLGLQPIEKEEERNA